jgi:uncharacterized membrane protein YhaH (DUF805 family)
MPQKVIKIEPGFQVLTGIFFSVVKVRAIYKRGTMNIGQAIASFFKNYANFKGRARRSEYWWAQLAIGVITMIIAAISIQTVNVYVEGLGDVPTITYGPLFWIWALGITLPGIALTVRRLHDTGRKGTYYFMSLIPFVGSILLIVRMAEDSQPGPNQYGNPVK